MKKLIGLVFILTSLISYAQVDTSYIFNTSMPYGTLDIRLAKSASRYYYLQDDKTFSYRESAPGVKTNTYAKMTSWDSSPYKQGNLREKNGTADYYVMNYRLLSPVNYNANYADGYPLIVMMHGAGERGNCWDDECFWATRTYNPNTNSPAAPTTQNHSLLNNDYNLSHGGRPHLNARNLAGSKLPNDPSLDPRAFPGFVLFPQNLNGWSTNSIQDAIRLIRLIVKKYKINPNRIYVHGLSDGGAGTYDIIKRAPWLFAAALPMSAITDAGIIAQGMTPKIANIPLWTFQGGQDTAPTPGKTAGYMKKFKEEGLEVRYTVYPTLGHGTWNTAYAEPDFFSWMLSKSKSNIHVFYNNPKICATNGQGVKMGLAFGFLAYQWEKDGAIISGANGAEYTATQPGVYRARFSRVDNPTSAQWNQWSAPVTVTTDNPVKAVITPLTSTHLRGPDNAAQNTVQLKSGNTNDKYFWYKNGVLIDIPNNAEDDTVSVYSITSTSTGTNGAYTLVTKTFGDCPSPTSDPLNLFFNNSAPVIADSNIPTSFRVTSKTEANVALAWQDNSNAELAFEIWRRKQSEAFVLAGRVNANAQAFNDTGLLPSTTYDYKIRVVNNAGRSKYAPSDDVNTNLTVTTNADNIAPNAPSGLAVVNNTINSISLKWNAATDNAAVKEYVIYYGNQSVSTNSSTPSFTISDLPANTNYSITIKALDYAGLYSPASNAVAGTTSVNGLWYGHSTGAWTDLDLITNWNSPEFTGHVPNFTLAPRTQEDFFNFEFTGYLYINTPGTYYFYINSDDGSRLYLDNAQVVDFDGLHGRTSQNSSFGIKSAPITLAAGAHPLRVIYLEYNGGQSLAVSYQGADTDNAIKNIPDGALTSGSSGTIVNTAPAVTITAPANDQNYTAPATINIAANATDSDGSVTKVEFYNGTTKLGEDTTSPYAFAWTNVSAGTYNIIAKAIDNNSASSTAQVSVIVNGTGTSCAGAGSIVREVWTGITGVNTSAIPVDTPPSSSSTLTIFESPLNAGDNYGARIRGYVCVPATGAYTFWIASDDYSELWLSTSESPANKVKIATVTGYTASRQWTKYTSQQSQAINLVAGQKYYIEALHKDATGGDNLAVGWQLPDGSQERPIPGNRLVPFTDTGSGAPVVDITSPAEGQNFTAPATVNIAATASASGGASVTKVEFYNGTTKLDEDLTSPYAYAWSVTASGNYTIQTKAIDSNGSEATASVSINVSSTSSCENIGTIDREIWTNVIGNTVASIPVNTTPTSVEQLTIFEEPSNVADDYGSRIRGYLCVPVTGDYTFWIASDDQSELWLSTTDNSASKVLIASVTGYTSIRQWTKYTSQQSAPISLVGGQRYYIEALHKEAKGGENLAVGWQLPDGTLERPIPGNRLAPLVFTSAASTSSADLYSVESDDTVEPVIDISPNPSKGGLINIGIQGSESLPTFNSANVQIMATTGEIVYNNNAVCDGSCEKLSVNIEQQLSPGVYLVNIIIEGKRYSRRLLVN